MAAGLVYLGEALGLLLLLTAVCCLPTSGAPGHIGVQFPQVLVGSVNFSLALSFPPATRDGRQWKPSYFFRTHHVDALGRQSLLSFGSFDTPWHSSSRSTQGSVDVIRAINLDRPLDPSLYTALINNIRPVEGSPFSYSKIVLSLYEAEDASRPFFVAEEDIFSVPGWASVLPSLVTVVLAISLKLSLLALLAGIWLGTTLLFGGNPFLGLARALDTIIVRSMLAADHAAVLLFCLFIGGMIGVLGVGGGAQGLAQIVSQVAKTRRRASLATFCLGVLILFDDYASCLITGITMKDITGMLRISREKLSFIVDTCAANTAALSIVSSWIGVEISYIKAEYSDLGLGTDGFGTFLSTLPYAFYPWLVLMFCLLGILLERDFGPMLKAERRALRSGLLVREGGVPCTGDPGENAFLTPKTGRPQLWWNAALPFATLFLIVLGAMVFDGYYSLGKYASFLESSSSFAASNNLSSYLDFLHREKSNLSSQWSLTGLVSSSVPFNCLLWASFLASAVAIFLVVVQGILSASEAMDAWMSGAKSMVFALLILILAWSLGDICKGLHSALWISSSLGPQISPGALPTLVFITASGVSFATGSAWGTMSILFPLMIRLAYSLAPADEVCRLATIAAILSGSVWGNQSSPIADSCIMSSISTGSDHADHVKTQAAYTIIVGLISIVTCYIPVGYGLYPWWIGYSIALSLFTALFFLVGSRPDRPEAPEKPAPPFTARIRALFPSSSLASSVVLL